MSTTNIVLVLTGARAGQTCVLGKYPFINGRITLQGDTTAMAGIIKYLGRTFKAFPEGSVELAFYQKGGTGGQCDLQEAPERGHSETAAPDVQPGGQGTPTFPTGEGSNAVDSKAGAEGLHAERDGQTPSIEEVLKLLDPHNNDHWTSNGLPRADVVSRLMGRTVNRGELHAAAPLFVRP
jgi:hypothetical protein